MKIDTTYFCSYGKILKYVEIKKLIKIIETRNSEILSPYITGNISRKSFRNWS